MGDTTISTANQLLDTLSSSPYQSLLCTNHAASSNDAVEIRKISASAMAKAAQLEAEIDTLRQKQSHLQQLADSYNNLLSHIRLLPDEVLQEVFISLAKEEWAEAKLSTPQPRVASSAWALSWVCSNWRNVSLATSRLWSFIFVTFDSSKDHGKGHATLFATHIARSKQSPLSLKLLLTRRVHKWIDESPIFHAFVPHFERVRHLIISASENVAVSDVFPGYADKLKALTTLELTQLEGIGDSFQKNKCLHRVNLELLYWGSFTSLSFAWSNLTCLSVFGEKGDFSDFLPLLAQATALEELWLYVFEDTTAFYYDRVVPATPQELPDTIRLERLRHLQLTMDEGALEAWNHWIPGRLIFPKLRSLVLRDMDDPLSDDTMTELCSAIKASGCQIDSVYLDVSNKTDRGVFRRLLLSIPHTRTLVIQTSGYGDDDFVTPHYIVDSLSRVDGEVLLPSLSTLKIKSYTMDDLGAPLIRLLKSRSSPCIKTIVLGAGDGPSFSEEDQDFIRQCKSRGLAFLVVGHHLLNIPELSWSPPFW